MAKVDPELFLQWAETFFHDDIKISKNEIKANSPFAIDDHKYHLWMNPTGGKKGVFAGVYRCWKSDRRGNLISLVSELEGIPYNKAEDLICREISLATLADKLDELFSQKPKIQEVIQKEPKGISIPESCYLINSLPPQNTFRIKSENILKERKIFTDGLYVCISGDYSNRIIIPYYNCYGDLIYWNGRSMNKNLEPKYRGPENIGIGKGDVLYAREWPKLNSRILLTEGEFDAMTLNECGFYGFALGGKSLTNNQIEMMREYLVTMAFDTDSAGRSAIIDNGNKLISSGFSKICYVRPPIGIKDWNEFYVKTNKEEVKNYILSKSKSFNLITASELLMKTI